MLQVENISFAYKSKTPILQDISFDVPKGCLCGLFGPNGCGKTTLFKCCLKFLYHNSGSITLSGKNINQISIPDMAKIVAYVPQDHKPPFPYLVKDLVLMGRTPHLTNVFGASKKDKLIVYEAMEMVGIVSFADTPYNFLSGGQRQLVLIARALAQNTPLLFLDEPTSALDFSNQIKILTILRQISENGKTIVACTHDPNHVLWFCDSVVVLDKHRFVGQGLPEDIFCDTLLDEVYEDMCSVKEVGSVKIVLPRHLARQRAA